MRMQAMFLRWSAQLVGGGMFALAFAALGVPAAVRGAEFDWEKKRAALGHQDKLRVLVDKVLSMSNQWVMTEKHMDEIRDAGFNVVVPRVGGEDMKRVARVAQMARDRGMFYMAWMRGTLSTKTGLKVVWANGVEQDLYSPNADALWDWMTGLILGHARLSAKNPAIVGSFLDFENYAKGRQRNCYFLSYDDKILAEFAKEKNLSIPALERPARHGWLEEQGHLAAFKAFQIASWRRRCRELRRQIDAINPRFQLIVYPRDTLFLHEAIYPEWATERAPLIFADHCTYNRPKQLPHAKGLQLNKRTLEEGMRFAASKKVPLLYMSGIDPVYEEADPEFCGRNAGMIAATCDGYWIFYEGPSYAKDHVDYFTWFSRANRAIVAGRWDFWTEPRETPDPVMAAHEKMLKRYCGAAVQPYSTEPMPKGADQTAYTVRHKGAFCVLVGAGETLEGRLEVRRLGRYTSGCEFTVFGPDRRKVCEGRAELDKPAELKFAAKQKGVYVVLVQTGSNPARLFVKNKYFCFLGQGRTNFLGAQPRSYFLPAPGASTVSLTLESPSPAETAMLTVVDPTGREAARGDTVADKKYAAKLSIPPELSRKAWSLRLEKASKGSLEDFWLTLEAGCAEFLATHPSRLLMWAK